MVNAPEKSVPTTTGVMAEWITPPGRPAHIEQLITGVERYDPAQVQVLEDYLSQQMSDGTYDPLANLATLKLYQFNPDLIPLASETPRNPTEAVHDSITVKILLLSIAHQPLSSDFSLGLALCGDRMSPLVTPQTTLHLFDQLSHLSLLLHSRRFTSFWSFIRSNETQTLQSFTAEIVGFDDMIRSGIASSISRCCRRIQRNRLAKYTGFEVDDVGDGERDALNHWIRRQGWTQTQQHDHDQIINIPENVENSPKKPVVTRETTSLMDLQRVIAKSVS